MNKMKMEAARVALLSKQGVLRRRSLVTRTREQTLVDDREANRTDQAANASPAQVLGHLEEHELRELGRVAAALGRLDARTYGLCVACGEAIATRRLEAIPEVDRCTTCVEQAALDA